jgi:hypothetical protein
MSQENSNKLPACFRDIRQAGRELQKMERKETGMEEIMKLAGNFGFPIAVSAYLLVRIEGKLNELSASITELAQAIAVLKVKGEVQI